MIDKYKLLKYLEGILSFYGSGHPIRGIHELYRDIEHLEINIRNGIFEIPPEKCKWNLKVIIGEAGKTRYKFCHFCGKEIEYIKNE